MLSLGDKEKYSIRDRMQLKFEHTRKTASMDVVFLYRRDPYSAPSRHEVIENKEK